MRAAGGSLTCEVDLISRITLVTVVMPSAHSAFGANGRGHDDGVIHPVTDPSALPSPETAASLPRAARAALAVGSDWLGSWQPTSALVVVAVLLVALTIVRSMPRRGWLNRRPGRRRRWPAVVGAVVTLVLAGGFAVNTQVGYVPNTSAAWLLMTGDRTVARAGTGELRSRTIAVPAALRMPASVTWVYTPPGYDAAAGVRYPVVYLLHGTPGQSSDWSTGGDIAHVMDVLIAEALVRPMIIVAPEVNGAGQDDSECLNSTRGGSQVETYLNDVVVPWTDANYATLADWQHRVIGGMSSGGFCALDQGLRHPELYGSIIALEPYGDPGSGGRAMLSTPAELAAHSPALYLPTMTFAHPVAAFLDVGGLGGGGPGSAVAPLVAQLRARGQDVLFRTEPHQTHNWTMARLGIPYGLVFVSEHMPT